MIISYVLDDSEWSYTKMVQTGRIGMLILNYINEIVTGISKVLLW
jgi:hypothetical protein